MEIKDKRLYVLLSKNNPCIDCKKKFHYSQMQYDHIIERGIKDFELKFGGLRSACGKSLEEIKEEIKKCDLLCANCHFLRTFKRKSNIEEISNKYLINMTNQDIIKTYKYRSNKKYESKNKCNIKFRG